MGSSLVVVESPAKARTISKYLGKGYKIMASVGHVKDLPKNTLGVDIEQDFMPEYHVIRGKGKILTEIRKAAAKADDVYLAPDPDREGEAIAWHIAEEIKKKNKNIHRILFHEVTKRAVSEALENPIILDQKKFESQQARRILDRLVGYQISPLLWERVRRGLSAGRVQSVAVRIVVDRENDIRAFESREFWTITADYLGSEEPLFTAKLLKVDGKKAELENKDQTQIIVDELNTKDHILSRIVKKERTRRPEPPFITSKLQQEASRRMHFTPKFTMMLAQQLYEGIEVGSEGAVGLITYMRTDSTRISDVALEELRGHIVEEYGEKYLPEKPRLFKNKKNSQDAHEAIRPTSIEFTPDRVKHFLTKDQLKLYRLIWNRFVASQMKRAIFDATTFDVTCGRSMLRATGQVLKFPGFTKVYNVTKDDDTKKNGKAPGNKLLPNLGENEILKLLKLDPKQNFTQPPPRFTEAMLVKELEDRGIGRPSTYASILSTIQDKSYADKKEGRLHPTELGEVVTGLMQDNFPNIMDSKFTADMEEQLDGVEEGKVGWLDLLNNFYSQFAKSLSSAKENMKNIKRQEEPTGISCPKCSKELQIKWGRHGSFVGCSSYPDCDFTSEFDRKEDGSIALQEEEKIDQKCDKCGGEMVIKNGKYGKFLACSKYPDCRNTKPLVSKVGMKCPEDGCKGEIIEKRTRRGKIFYGCSDYPTCKFASWKKPVPEQCPSCDSPYLVVTSVSGDTTNLRCPKCGFVKEMTENDNATA